MELLSEYISQGLLHLLRVWLKEARRAVGTSLKTSGGLKSLNSTISSITHAGRGAGRGQLMSCSGPRKEGGNRAGKPGFPGQSH